MDKKEKDKAIEAYYAWCEERQVTLDGVKEIRASQDAWLGCWKYLNGGTKWKTWTKSL